MQIGMFPLSTALQYTYVYVDLYVCDRMQHVSSY